ncbi:uncharacterized protein SPAPADRAFT_63110 [Spathaspora passalidarum NRRL Y-27907]|uniref:Uncharacterized protein n=1 Tax=Spathaspora passalidarum (strain NRRL Y-27907 / 11-Y1) TaxID=619300 RepID=G3AUH6_SPAPN|nr:uncharacterized protein SPAPADRAFT_63110 [Spathaspora passalidarum NRRL Y-27907]EGW30262.1 hypothetical protein SPAPADRAFT_63110 [Spathaspora passalidarum NRRL Y-27907]
MGNFAANEREHLTTFLLRKNILLQLNIHICHSRQDIYTSKVSHILKFHTILGSDSLTWRMWGTVPDFDSKYFILDHKRVIPIIKN